MYVNRIIYLKKQKTSTAQTESESIINSKKSPEGAEKELTIAWPFGRSVPLKQTYRPCPSGSSISSLAIPSLPYQLYISTYPTLSLFLYLFTGVVYRQLVAGPFVI
jgi:hypothetical protein